LLRMVRQEGVSLRCRRFQGTYLARGGHSWFNPGWREGVSSHCGKVCPLPMNHTGLACAKIFIPRRSRGGG
jgi:hypothetical protein